MIKHLAAVLLPLLGAGCAAIHSPTYLGSAGHYSLQPAASSGETIDLHFSGTDASLQVRSTRTVPVMHLGIEVNELRKTQAEGLALRPYAGLYVRQVEAASPADRAGLRPGDLITALNGRDAYRMEHLESFCAGASRDSTAVLTVLVAARTDRRIDLQVAVEEREEERVEVTRVPLEQPTTTGHPYAGVVLRGMPPQWSERIYGNGQRAVVISGVDVGSPAYLAGLRAGDIIIRHVDGRPVGGVEELVREIRGRGPRGDAMTFEVESRGEPFSAEVTLADYTRGSRARFPLLFSVRNDARTSAWSLGPWGLLANYDGAYNSSETREAESSSSFSMLLGLIKVKSTSRGSTTRLLWLLKIGS